MAPGSRIVPAALAMLLAGSAPVPAGSALPAPGTYRLPLLTGQAAIDQADILIQLRQWQKKVPSEARTFEERGSREGSIRYRLFKPAEFDPAKTYPLVLSLHGGGPRENFDHLLMGYVPGFAYGLGRLVSPELQSKYPCFVVAPWSAGGGWD